jgi:hypothetical protein
LLGLLRIARHILSEKLRGSATFVPVCNSKGDSLEAGRRISNVRELEENLRVFCFAGTDPVRFGSNAF